MSNQPLRKLLVVDDDLDILKIVEISLEGMTGVTFKYCSSGQQAIKEATTFHPDLMLVDIMMPAMDGFQLVQAIKALPELSNTPIVFLTAKIQKDEIAECHKAGVDYIIPKPFDPITLPDQIKEIWEKVQVC